MRLLQLASNGGFSLTSFSKAPIPPYAILSHTWGNEEEEVTLGDLIDGTGSNKKGYQKLQFCGNQAKNDGLHYFWVDTCCIDKSNNNELTKAINSMFRWYQEAARCYVYLADVSILTHDGQSRHVEWESAFRNSRWFRRGWTLQEVLAPRIVIFYSRDQERLGDKVSLEAQLHKITGIALEALRGQPLSDFSVEERFIWGAGRQTTEEEDMAYCLLGIFNVNLPLIPGEVENPEVPQILPARCSPPSKIQGYEDAANATNWHLNKTEFAKCMMLSDIAYYGYGAGSIEADLLHNNVENAFVLYFTEKLRLEAESWAENYELLLKISKDANSKCVVAMVDCDATGVELEHVRISQFRKGYLVVHDVLYQTKYGICIARCRGEKYLDRDSSGKPLQRSVVKIACPGPDCEKGVLCDWICPNCRDPLEFGVVDHFIYCDCGSSRFDQYEFKCRDFKHGSRYEQYEKETLLQYLQSLQPLQQLNILIVGETGVGKSTWINAFINYLTHESLDEAMKNPQLDWVIPCSFAVQSINTDHEIIQNQIKIGHRIDEADGSTGASATQRGGIYSVRLADTTIRLIDTPGIGDTRGIDYDKANIANILALLANLEHLHGILFLMRCNTYRLTLSFRFVIDELLAQLQRDASRNIVFGLTHTRISSYMPGDTFGALQRFLRDHQSIDIRLSRHNVYCFDSESFRFLAAKDQGLTIGNIQDYRLSWEKSQLEVSRLIEHFRSLTPHVVRKTLDLRRIRTLFTLSMKSMIDIMQMFNATTRSQIEDTKELSAIKLKEDQLRARLSRGNAKQDEEVEEQMKRNDANVALIESAIEQRTRLLADTDYEYKEVRDAAVRIGLFLKNHSITPYNEGELSYLDRLIESERVRMELGGDRALLEQLLRQRQEYVQQVGVFSKSMENDSTGHSLDEAGVEDLVTKLYHLKLFGNSIRGTIDRSSDVYPSSNYRDQPYRSRKKDFPSTTGLESFRLRYQNPSQVPWRPKPTR